MSIHDLAGEAEDIEQAVFCAIYNWSYAELSDRYNQPGPCIFRSRQQARTVVSDG
jgi:hypothetical protein